MAVSGIDRRQALAARRNPICQGASLLDGDKGIDEDGVPLAVDEGRRYRRPHRLLRAWKQVAVDTGNARRHKHVPVQRKVSPLVVILVIYAHCVLYRLVLN
jgi:hypothetical protein